MSAYLADGELIKTRIEGEQGDQQMEDAWSQHACVLLESVRASSLVQAMLSMRTSGHRGFYPRVLDTGHVLSEGVSLTVDNLRPCGH